MSEQWLDRRANSPQYLTKSSTTHAVRSSHRVRVCQATQAKQLAPIPSPDHSVIASTALVCNSGVVAATPRC